MTINHKSIHDATHSRTRTRGAALIVGLLSLLAVLAGPAGDHGMAEAGSVSATPKTIAGCRWNFTVRTAADNTMQVVLVKDRACVTHPKVIVRMDVTDDEGGRVSRQTTFDTSRFGARFNLTKCESGRQYQGIATFWKYSTGQRYSHRLGTGVPVSLCGADYRMVVPKASVQPAWLTKPHHDYPASDLPVAAGTPFYAVTSGTVRSVGGGCGLGYELRGDDGVIYTYCHASYRHVASGGRVSAGQFLGKTGNTGNSFGPHLHLQVRAGGSLRCPQQLLAALYSGNTPPNPATLPASGCSY